MGVRKDQKKKEDPNAHSINDLSYLVSFYRFPVCDFTGCSVADSPMWLWLPDMNGDLDIFKGLAIKA